MLGHSLKLMGLATFNIMVALGLTSGMMSSNPADRPSALTEDNVSAFIKNVAAISSGSQKDMDQFAATKYFMSHVADNANFKSTLRYAIPDMPDSERNVTMDKNLFISDLLKDLRKGATHETTVLIQYIRVAADGHSATAVTSDTEAGVASVTSPEGDQSMVPVTGTSYCEQAITLSHDHLIQLSGATCTTDLALAATQ